MNFETLLVFEIILLTGWPRNTTISPRFPAAIQNAQYGYHCSIRSRNFKAWTDVNSPHFSYWRSTQHIGVMESGTKPVITPTKTNYLEP